MAVRVVAFRLHASCEQLIVAGARVAELVQLGNPEVYATAVTSPSSYPPPDSQSSVTCETGHLFEMLSLNTGRRQV